MRVTSLKSGVHTCTVTPVLATRTLCIQSIRHKRVQSICHKHFVWDSQCLIQSVLYRTETIYCPFRWSKPAVCKRWAPYRWTHLLSHFIRWQPFDDLPVSTGQFLLLTLATSSEGGTRRGARTLYLVGDCAHLCHILCTARTGGYIHSLKISHATFWEHFLREKILVNGLVRTGHYGQLVSIKGYDSSRSMFYDTIKPVWKRLLADRRSSCCRMSWAGGKQARNFGSMMICNGLYKPNIMTGSTNSQTQYTRLVLPIDRHNTYDWFYESTNRHYTQLVLPIDRLDIQDWH